MALHIVSQDDTEKKKEGPVSKVIKNKTTQRAITKIALQVKRQDRYSIYIDGVYSFSLHEYQLAGAGLRVGMKLTANELEKFANESQFGKAYERTLNYVMLRPRSEKEIKEYLTRTFLYPKPKSFVDRDGTLQIKKQKVDVPNTQAMIARVLARLHEKGYIDDTRFASAWVASRQQLKQRSTRKLRQELQQKGIAEEIIAKVLQNSETTERDNVRVVIAKKRRLSRYQDETKLIQYLLRQGFLYDDIKDALS